MTPAAPLTITAKPKLSPRKDTLVISAHGATIDVTSRTVTITYSPLLAALQSTHGAAEGGASTSTRLSISDITDIDTRHPTAVDLGWARLGGVNHTIRFAPNQENELDTLLAMIDSARNGELPDEPAAFIPGLDFVAIDVETANDDWGSICQIGVVRYTNGQAGASDSWLCTPPPGLERFDALNIGIHGITPDDVADAPAFGDVLGDVVAAVGDLPVVAHNAQFDMTAFSRACAAAGQPVPHWTFGCSLALARAAKLGISNHRLPTVAAHFGVELAKHHDALSDARACGDIIVGLASAGVSGGSGTSSDEGFAGFFWASGFTLGELTPDKVLPVLRTDARGLNIAAQRKRLFPGTVVDAAAEVPEEKPRRRQKPAWEKAATPSVIPETNTEADPEGALYGHNVTLTGDFEPYDKSMLWSGIAERGGVIGKNVTKKTTLLVCGPWHTVTSKQKRAEELIEKGQEITLWTADQLYRELGLDEDPPF